MYVQVDCIFFRKCFIRCSINLPSATSRFLHWRCLSLGSGTDYLSVHITFCYCWPTLCYRTHFQILTLSRLCLCKPAPTCTCSCSACLWCLNPLSLCFVCRYLIIACSCNVYPLFTMFCRPVLNYRIHFQF